MIELGARKLDSKMRAVMNLSGDFRSESLTHIHPFFLVFIQQVFLEMFISMC